ncbi:MAG: energy-coupling factor ABC transporter ATP-binding protein [Bryobacteraceae bacterium]|nr:energy-coupling factor ABC transporter ATP-binding protein [Bryobacteraceae bacterium]
MSLAARVENVQFRFGERPVLRGVSFTVARGESVGIAGPNGAGKSTLLWCLMGLLKPVSGSAQVFGRFAAVFQNPEDQLFMPTILEDVVLPLESRGIARDQARARALEALRAVALDHAAPRPGHQLSLGERKRAALAAALALEPDLLLLDEPTSELDPRSCRLLAGHLSRLPCARLIASHHLDFLAETTTRLLILDEGRIAAEGSTRELLADAELLLRHGLK